MKTSNFFEMSNEELSIKLASLKEELFNLRFQHKAGQLESPKKIATCKKDIAKVNTIIRQRELGISVAPTKKASKKAAK